jgi:HEAT repeat protein
MTTEAKVFRASEEPKKPIAKFIIILLSSLAVAASVFVWAKFRHKDGADVKEKTPAVRTTEISSHDDSPKQASSQQAIYRGQPTSVWVERLKSGDMETRKTALVAIAHIGEIDPEAHLAIPVLIEALKDEDFEVRLGCARALCIIGEADSAIPFLIEASRDRDNEARLKAISMLGSAKNQVKIATLRLSELLDDDANDVRLGAMWSLGKIGSGAVEALPRLASKISAKDDRQSRIAICAMRDIGPSAVPFLLNKICGFVGNGWLENKALITEISDTLVAMGANSAPALVEFLGSKDWHIHDQAKGILLKMGESATSALLAARDHQDPSIRKNVSEILEELQQAGLPDWLNERQAIEKLGRDRNYLNFLIRRREVRVKDGLFNRRDLFVLIKEGLPEMTNE